MNRHRALGCVRMISAQTRSAFVVRENRFTLFPDHAPAPAIRVLHALAKT
jgi:hypothetical protein